MKAKNLVKTKTVIKNIPLPIVSKTVGHKSMNMLITYTQNKNVSSLLDSLSKGKF